MKHFARTSSRIAVLALGLTWCTSSALATVRLLPSNVDWTTNGSVIHFQLHFDNPDPTATLPVTGMLTPQAFGAFVPAGGSPVGFDVPSIAAHGFFDVFLDVPLTQLPQNPPNVVPGGGAAGPCPQDNHWDGNVDITWSGAGGPGEVHRHQGHLKVCPGSGCSLIHVVTGCSNVATWSFSGLCSGFHAQLLDEDMTTAAPNPLPPGWSGWVCSTADPGVTIPTTCCFALQLVCGGQPAVVELCATTCNCNPTSAVPQPTTIEWSTLTGTSTVRFHVRWTNPSPSMPTAPGTATLSSQEFGVFLPDSTVIGQFTLPSIAVAGFFDIFTDVALSSLPANPPKVGGPPPNGPCPPDRHWNGNVDLVWNTAAGGGQVNKHVGEIVVCPGSGSSLIHLISGCTSTLGASWSISGLCSGFNATLLDEDFTPAPNPLTPGWTGYVSITAAASTPVPDTCCFKVTITCAGASAVVKLCAITCNCTPTGVGPQPGTMDWSTLTGTNTVRFHVRWLNPDPLQPTAPATGTMSSQLFGAFLPDAGLIGQFEVPSIAVAGFFDIFFDVAKDSLPPSAQKMLTGGGPPPTGGPCPQDTHWDGNVDVTWTSTAGTGTVNKHYGTVLLNTAGGHGLIHVISGCTTTPGPTWSIGPLCPGFTATLVNEDYSPAPDPLPPGWTGWLWMTATGATVGATCCVDLTLHCGGSDATIEVCATACDWGTLGVGSSSSDLQFGIRAVVPNPTSRAASVSFVLTRADRAALEVFDAAGHRVRRVVDGMFGTGPHSAVWDGRDARGNVAKPGVYFIRLTTARQTDTHELVLRP